MKKLNKKISYLTKQMKGTTVALIVAAVIISIVIIIILINIIIIAIVVYSGYQLEKHEERERNKQIANGMTTDQLLSSFKEKSK